MKIQRSINSLTVFKKITFSNALQNQHDCRITNTPNNFYLVITTNEIQETEYQSSLGKNVFYHQIQLYMQGAKMRAHSSTRWENNQSTEEAQAR